MVTLKIQKNVSLADLSTFKIGGRVKEFMEVHSPDEFIEALRQAQQRKPFGAAQGENPLWRIFAGGSNVVFPDNGLDCLLIRMKGGKIDYEDSGMIVADAGVSLADVITFAIRKGLQGLETLSGIPGTIGGAVFGNAGAYGHSVAEAIERVEILLPRAERTQNKVQNRRGNLSF